MIHSEKNIIAGCISLTCSSGDNVLNMLLDGPKKIGIQTRSATSCATRFVLCV